MHNALVSLDCPACLSLRNVPDSNFTVATAGDHGVQAVWVLDHRVDTVNVTAESTKERLSKHSFGLDRVEGTNIFSSLFKRMDGWIKIFLNLVDVLCSLTNVIAGRSRKGFYFLESDQRVNAQSSWRNYPLTISKFLPCCL